MKMLTAAFRCFAKSIHSKLGLAACCLLVAVLCIYGCTPLRYHGYADDPYPGLGQRLNQVRTNATMHIVVVHGIGEHSPGYSTNLANNLARQLKLVKESEKPPAPLVSSKGVTNWLTEYTYAAEERKVIFHEVTWSPTTTVIKQKAFTNDQTLNRHRVLINRDLKTSLLDDSLSDAVLYLNPSFRSAMQEPILQTIDLVVPQIGPHDHIVLITASLGSKMTFDTVLDHTNNAPVQQFSERVGDIIMLANQLPLLHLGTGTNLDEESPVAPETDVKKFVRMSRKRRKKWAESEGKSTGHQPEPTIHIVACTDPNDLLSYPLTKGDVVPDDGSPDDLLISLSNIYSPNASAILFVLENPAAAHENYDLNKWLLKKLVDGFPKPSGKTGP